MDKITMDDWMAIQNLVHSYSFLGDTGRYLDIPELFSDNAVYDETCLGVPLSIGKDAITRLFQGASENYVFIYFIHFVTNVWIREYDGKTAGAICYLRGEGCFADGAQALVRGYYDDTYEKLDGRWLFKSRKLVPFAPPSGWKI